MTHDAGPAEAPEDLAEDDDLLDATMDPAVAAEMEVIAAMSSQELEKELLNDSVDEADKALCSDSSTSRLPYPGMRASARVDRPLFRFSWVQKYEAQQ